MKLVETAYSTDPRIRKMNEEEAAAKEAAKQAKKDDKIRRARELEEKQKAIDDAAQRKKDEEEAAKLADKEAVKVAQKLYRQTVKQLIDLCAEKMPGTKYDKFHCESLIKKYRQQDQLDGLIE